MRRSLLAVSLVVAAAALSACADKPLPTSPEVTGPAALHSSINVDGCVDPALNALGLEAVDAEVKGLINNLFIDANHRSSTLTSWENLKKDKLEGRPLQNHIDLLAKWTLEHLSANELMDPDGLSGILNATTGSVRLLDLVFRCSGETPTTLPEPPEGFNAAFELVDPSTADQQFITSGDDAVTFIPGDGLDARTLLVMVRQPEEVTVNTPFPVLSNVVDIALAGGKLRLDKKVSVLFCPLLELPEAVSARAVVAHQLDAAAPGAPVGEGVEYLDPPQGGTLDCDLPHTASASWRHEKGFLKQRAMQVASLARKAWRLVGPGTLYAGHAAIGGSLGPRLSPLVVVDPFVGTEIIVGTIPTTTYGEAVSFNATLKITSGPASWIGLPVTQSIVGMPALTLSALQLTAALDGQSQTQSLDDGTDDGIVNFSFTGVNAATDQNATVSFPLTNNEPANAPLFGGSTASGTFTVNPRPLSVTAQAETWIYGSPEPVTGTFTADQVQYDEPVTPTFTTTADNFTSVNTDPGYPGALVAGVDFGGARAANYVVTATNATLKVEPAPLSITSNTFTREYGVANPAPTDPSLTGDVTGEKNGETILIQHTINPALGATADANTDPGYTEAITPSLNGVYSNYVVTQVTKGTLRVLKAPISFGINAGAPHVYGEANIFTSTLGATRNSDVLTTGFSPPASTLFPVGSNVITGTLSGDEVGNYEFTAPTSTLEITARALTGEIDDKTKVQGAANPPLTGSVTNTVAGDGFVVSYVTTATTGSAVGTYPITVDLSGAGGSNYSWNTANDGALTVTANDIPNPILVFSNTETSGGFDRHFMNVTNSSSYPADMFATTSAFGPCGLNPTPSRSWVDIYNATTNTVIFGFCALGSPENLNGIWFGVTAGTTPPPVYIKIVDRSTGISYTSNTITIPAP